MIIDQLLIASLLSIPTASGGSVLLVPEEYATIQEAADAIVFPQFQTIDVAPGVWTIEGLLELGGASIRGRTGLPEDVVLTGAGVGGELYQANAKDLTLHHLWLGGNVSSSIVEACHLWGVSVTGSLMRGGGSTGGQFTECHFVTGGSSSGGYTAAQFEDCVITYDGSTFEVHSSTVIRTQFLSTPVRSWGWPGSKFLGCHFIDSPEHGLEVQLTPCAQLVNCTFVGTAGFDLVATNGECGVIYAVNSIISFEGLTPDIGLNAAWCMEADEFVASDGSLLPGSTAFGAGNPHAGFHHGIGCTWNIGADQTGWPMGEDCVAADTNHDGAVDGADLGLLLANWGRAFNGADINFDGVITGADLGILLSNWLP